jgi:hypothetical protein
MQALAILKTFVSFVGAKVAVAMNIAASAQATMAIGSAVIAGSALVAKKAMSLFEVKMSVPDTDRSRQSTVKSASEPQKIIYGEALVSGPISFIGLGGVDNKDLYQTIVLAGHEVNAITDVYFDDFVITNTQINSGNTAGGAVNAGAFQTKNNVDIVTINKYRGTNPQSADSMFVGQFGNYTTNHRGDGIAYLAMKWVLNGDSAKTWDKYAPGNVKALVQGKKVYDPRLEVTAGGDAGDSPGNASYIAYSDNPALCAIDYLMDQTVGLNVPSSKINWSAVITAANGCDATVTVPGGTEKTFTCNGVVFATDTHQKNINKILSSMNGSLVYSNGKYVLRAGIYANPTVSLNEDDLIGSITVKTSIDRSERVNTIKGLFLDPSQGHKMVEFPKVQLSNELQRDNNVVMEKETSLAMTNTSYMAQRLAHKIIKSAGQQKVITFPANYTALNVTAGDRVQVSIEELSWVNKEFICVGWVFSEDGGVLLTLREDSSDAYSNPASYSQVSGTGTITDASRGVPSPSGLQVESAESKIFLNWVNPTKPSDFNTIEVWASATNVRSNAVNIGETNGTQFTHDQSNSAITYAVGDTLYYWVRAKKNVGDATDTDAVSGYFPATTTSSANVTVTAAAVDWDNVANPTIGIDINNDTISINTGSATTTSGQAVAQSGIEQDVEIAQGGIRMNQGGSIRGGQSAYNTGTGFFLGYVDGTPTGKYKFSIGNAGNNSLAFDGTNLAVTGDITATSGTFTGTVNASAGAFTGDVSTDSKFVAGSGATSATMDGGDTNFKFYAGAAAAGDSPFKVDADGVVTADRIVITRPDDPSAVIFDSAQDGLVGVGLSSLSLDSDNAVAQVADELTSNTDYARLILSASAQTLTIKALFPLGYEPFAISSAEDFPDSITLTLQVASVTNGTPGTFNNIAGGSKTFTRRVYSSGAPSDDDYYSVYDSGTGWYKKGKDAVDGQFNLAMTYSGIFNSGDKAIRVQVSYVAGSGATNANPSSSSKRTLYFNSATQYFTINDSDIIRDQAAGSLLTGDVILSASSGTRSISWRDSDTQDENWSIETETHYDPNTAAALFFKYDNGSTAPIAFASNGNILTAGDFYTGTGAITAATASIGGGYGSTGLSIASDGNLSTDGSVVIGGDLTVNGTTTTVDTDNLTVKDNNITLNYATGDSSSTANNAGITIQDAVNSSTDASLLWKTASDSFLFSHKTRVPDLEIDGQTLTSADDLDSVDDGFYKWASSKPTNAPKNYMVMYQMTDPNQKIQIAWGSSGSGELYVRRADSGTFYAWAEMLTTASATSTYLPLAGGTLTGNLNVEKSGADSIVDVLGNSSYDPVLNLRSDQGSIASEGFQIWYDNSVGDVHLHTTYNNDVAAIRFHTRTGANKSTSNERFTINGNGLINITTGNLAMNGSTVISNDRSIDATSIETSGSYSGGSGDMTNVTNPQLKIGSAGTSDYWRIPHFSQSSTVSGVYNYQTGKNVYWGEDSDTGTYYFRGRDLDAENITTRNITATGVGSIPHNLYGTGSTLYLNIGDGTTQTSYAGMKFTSDDGNTQFFKAGSTYSSWGGADAFNIYNSNGPLAFHPSATQNVLKLTSTEIIASRTVTGVQYSASRSAIYSATTQGTVEGALHLGPSLTTAHAGSAITFGASDSGGGATAQAGIYTRTDGTYGTELYFSTTDSYTTGPKTAISIDSAGNTNIVRGSFTSSGNITTTANGSFSLLQGSGIGVNNTNETTKYGISLYGGSGNSTNPTYGMMFTGTAGSGTHGSVTGNWATYFTMNSSAGRGWIFRDVTNGNKASISNQGNATFDGSVYFGSELHGSSKRIFTTSDSYLRMNQSSEFSAGVWIGSSNLMTSSGYIAAGSNGGQTTSRVYIKSGTYNGVNVIALDGTDGSISSGAITSSGLVTADRFLSGIGSVASPAFQVGDTNSGFYDSGANMIGVSLNGALEYDFQPTGLYLSSNGLFDSGNIVLSNNKTITLYTSSGASGTGSMHLPRGGQITFYGNSNNDHSIASRSAAGTITDDLRISSYGSVILDLDSNANNTANANFIIGRHGGGTSQIATLLTVSGEDGTITHSNFELDTYVDGTVPMTLGKLIIKAGTKTGWAVGDELGSIDFYVVDGSGIGARNAARIVAVNGSGNGTTTTTHSGELHFYTSPYNANLNSPAALVLQKNNDAVFGGAISVPEVYFNSGARFLDSNINYTIHKAGSTSSGGLQMQNSDSATQGYFYWNTAGIGILSADGGWAIQNTNSATTIHHATTFNSTVTTVGDIQVNGNQVRTANVGARVKYSVWSGTTYGIGMETGYTFGAINNNYVMSFQMNNTSDRGFWWGDTGHTNAQGAMALSTDGYLTVARGARIGYGESDTVHPVAGLQVNGITAANGGLSQDGHTLINGTDTWYRTNAHHGIYFASYAGGVHMTDTTWVRTYNNKKLYVGGGIAEIATTGNVTAYYSDMRLKTKTADIDNALEKVNSLSGFKYVENDLAKELGYSNDKQQVGLSAQQIQAVLPEAVSLAPIDMDTDEHTGEITSKSGENYLTVDYSKLVPLMVEAIKELTQEVESLKTKLKEK